METARIDKETLEAKVDVLETKVGELEGELVRFAQFLRLGLEADDLGGSQQSKLSEIHF